MSWTPLDAQQAAGLVRAANTILAVFQGRAQLRPFASFDADTTQNSLEVQFTDTSSSPNGAITSWFWDFGDGGTSTVQHPSHTYATDAGFLVSLVVTDVLGRKAQVFQLVVASVIEIPDENPSTITAKFSSSVNGLTATFTDLSTVTDSTIVDWAWKFGEGPTASFTSSVNALVVAFTNTSSAVAPATLSTFLWDFGDGATSTTQHPSHTYATGGTYNVSLTVSDSDGNTDTVVNAVVPVGGDNTSGIPFFTFAQFSSASSSGTPLDGGVTGFTACIMACSPSTIIDWIENVRTRGMSVVLFLAGGGHSNYKTNNQFDINKWFAKIDTFNTANIKNAIEIGIGDGTILGNALIDEPEISDWGGVITKPMLDSMADYVHTKISPNLPCGVNGGSAAHTWRTFETYQKVDYCNYQFAWKATAQTPAQWRDAVLAQAAKDKVAVTFGVNLYRGEDVGGCILNPTGDACLPTASDITTAGAALASRGVGFECWRYHSAIWSRPELVSALTTVGLSISTRPRRSWMRP